LLTPDALKPAVLVDFWQDQLLSGVAWKSRLAARTRMECHLEMKLSAGRAAMCGDDIRMDGLRLE
jgi:hypothetical protein